MTEGSELRAEASFSAEWLALREPADFRARNATLALLGAILGHADKATDSFALNPSGSVAGHIGERPRHSGPSADGGAPLWRASVPPLLRVVDLGAGTGANLRWLAPRWQAWCECELEWHACDHDSGLLEVMQLPDPWRARGAPAKWQRRRGQEQVRSDTPGLESRQSFVVRHVVDLAQDLESVIDSVRPHWITASALFDLCSAAFIDRLVSAADRHNAGVLASLSFDGRLELHASNGAMSTQGLSGVDCDDWLLAQDLFLERAAAINADQRRDKGFGPALGPDAADYLASRMGAAGFTVDLVETDWRLGANDLPLIKALFVGWMKVPPARAPADVSVEWSRLRALIEMGATLVVGHRDVVSRPRVCGRNEASGSSGESPV
ncbi:MAG: hypothetical protein ACK4IT_02205 [Thioalkalivibrionaceae bacterium]